MPMPSSAVTAVTLNDVQYEMEARVGIEPTNEGSQPTTLPFGHRATVSDSQRGGAIPPLAPTREQVEPLEHSLAHKVAPIHRECHTCHRQIHHWLSDERMSTLILRVPPSPT